MDVLRLLTRGLYNYMVAENLHFSDSTPRNHVSAMISKLDVAELARVAILAIRHGLDQT